MTRMRSAMPVVVIGAAVLFILLIVLEWGMDITGINRNRVSASDKLGSVGGVDLSYKDFEADLTRTLEAQRAQQPNMTEDQEAQTRDMVFERFVTKTLMEKYLRGLRLDVTDDEVRDILLDNPPSYLRRQFTDSTGNFDVVSYQTALERIATYQSGGDAEQDRRMDTARQQLLEIEDNVRETRLGDKFQSVVGASLLVTDADVHQKFFNENARADVEFIDLDESRIPNNAVSVGDDEVQKYYAEHPEEFVQKPARLLRAAFFYLLPSASDSQSVERKFRTLLDSVNATHDTAHRAQLYEQFSSRYNETATQNDAFIKYKDLSPARAKAYLGLPVGGISDISREPDGYHVYRVMEERPGDSVYARYAMILLRGTLDSALSLAKTILGGLQPIERAPFPAMAAGYSQDLATAQRGGDVGYVTRAGLPPEIAKAVFTGPVGTVQGPIVSGNAVYIIKVTDRGSRELRVHDILMSIHPSAQTRQMLEHQAQDFRDRVARGENLDTVAANLHLHLFTSPPLQRSTPFLGAMDLTTWAFAAKKGEVSEPRRIRGNTVVAVLTDVREKGVKPLDEVRADIRARIVHRKKLDNLMAKAQEIIGELHGDSLSRVSAFDTSLKAQAAHAVQPWGSVPGIGMDPAFTAAAYALQNIGQTSDPVRGQRGVYLIRLLSKALPSDSMYALQKDVIRNSLLQQRRQALVQAFLQAQREQADVVDNRDKFYRY